MEAQRAIGATELVCGILLVLGLCSRLAALVIVVIQVGAIVLVSGKYALDVVRLTPVGKADFTHVGPEYNLLLIAMSLGVLLLGSGCYSLDRCCHTWWCGRKAPAASPPPSTTSGVA